jgi:hypothetical protein
MCRAVNCKICGKTTWAGCGQHVDQVMAKVPADRRCQGHSGDQRPHRSLIDRIRRRP